MSAVQATRPAFEPEFEQAPRLRLQPLKSAPARMGNFSFVLFLIIFLGVGMAGVLMLATSLQGQSVELDSLQRKAAALSYEQAALEAQVEDVSSSQHLASRAWELGMRPNTHPVFLVMPDGQVLGQPVPVTGNELTAVAPKPSPQPPSPQPPTASSQPAPNSAATNPADTNPAAPNQSVPNPSAQPGR